MRLTLKDELICKSFCCKIVSQAFARYHSPLYIDRIDWSDFVHLCVVDCECDAIMYCPNKKKLEEYQELAKMYGEQMAERLMELSKYNEKVQ